MIQLWTAMLASLVLMTLAALFTLSPPIFSLVWLGNAYGLGSGPPPDLTLQVALETRRAVHQDWSIPDLATIQTAAQIPAFTIQEVVHLQDVAALLDRCRLYAIAPTLGLGLTLLLMPAKWTAAGLRLAAITAPSVLTIIGIVALWDFRSFWRGLHHFAFIQGNWAFPSEAALIQLFPHSFWGALLAVGWGLACGLSALLWHGLRRTTPFTGLINSG